MIGERAGGDWGLENRESGIGNRKSGIGNRESGIGTADHGKAEGQLSCSDDRRSLHRTALPSPTGRRCPEGADEGAGEACIARSVRALRAPGPSPQPLSRGERGSASLS
ncbi:hypothetical protein DYQ95_12510 [Xanthomonas sp. LMG 9002]|nr:hypothetical protein [Xanthomonas sp. LMG 9002]